jgi:hypothetical protein
MSVFGLGTPTVADRYKARDKEQAAIMYDLLEAVERWYARSVSSTPEQRSLEAAWERVVAMDKRMGK